LNASQQASSRELYLSGLESMRRGVLLHIVSDILGLILLGLIWIVLPLLLEPLLDPFMSLTTWTEYEEPPWEAIREILSMLPVIIPAILVIAALLLATFILWLIGVWGFFVPGASRVGKANPEFSTAATLIKIGYFWGILVLLISLVVIGVVVAYAIITQSPFILIALLGLVPVILVCIILILVGYVGLLVLVYKFHELERIGLYLAVFILLILDLVLGFVALVPYTGVVIIPSGVISLVAWILLYVALRESIKRAQQAPPTPPQPTAPPPV